MLYCSNLHFDDTEKKTMPKAAVTPSCTSLSCKIHARHVLCEIEWVIAIMMWQLRGVCGCHRIYLTLFFTKITLRGSYRINLREGITKA